MFKSGFVSTFNMFGLRAIWYTIHFRNKASLKEYTIIFNSRLLYNYAAFYVNNVKHVCDAYSCDEIEA